MYLLSNYVTFFYIFRALDKRQGKSNLWHKAEYLTNLYFDFFVLPTFSIV